MEAKTTTNFFWRQPNTPEIKIVNPADFSKPEIIQKIGNSFGSSAFGLTDVQEIKLRNELSAFFLNNKDIKEKIAKWKAKTEKFRYLPTNEDDFLATYEQPENPYWILVKEIINEFSKPNAPKRIREFAEQLQDSLDLEEDETIMAARISAKLKTVTFMDGVADLRLCYYDNNRDDTFIVGRKAYSAAWSNIKVTPPKWTKNFFCKTTGIRFLISEIIAEHNRHKANRSAAIFYFPTCLFGDICNGLKTILQSPPEIPYWETLLHKLEQRKNLIFTVYFRYDQGGLKIKVIGLTEKHPEDADFELAFKNFNGYTPSEKKIANCIQEQIIEKIAQTEGITGLSNIHRELQEKFQIFNKFFALSSPQTDAELKWYALENLYNTSENKKTFQELKSQRNFLNDTMNQLSNLSQFINLFEEEARKRQIPICVPQIKNDGKVGVSFVNLAPIGMMNQNKEMIPFTMPTINGRMVCLTGRHGGGKSVAGRSVIESIYLAQSGLPVFAESFSVDVKTVLGAVINDEGEGSKATVFVEKVKNLFSEISKVPKEKSLIFIDEIGNSTQEDSGFDLGKLILIALRDKGYSVIFNTQIMRLAEYAKDLGAVCLKVNKNHAFSEGIGDGQMDKLIKESGLDKYFN